MSALPHTARARQTIAITTLLALTTWLTGCGQPPVAQPPAPQASACAADCEEAPATELNIPWGP